MADENENAPAPAQQPPAEDPNLAALRAELAAERQAREEAARRADSAERKYNEDMQRVAQAWQAAQAANAPSRDAAPDDPDRIMSSRDVDARLKEATDRVVQTFSQTQVTAFDNIRQQNRERMFANTSKFPLADKWRDEIEALATQAFNANPMEMAKPDAYEKLYKLVRGMRYEELRDHELAEREAAKKRAREEYGEDDGDVDEPLAAAPAPRARPAPPPAGDASGSLRAASNAVRRAPRVQLDNDLERMQAERYFGGDAAAFKRAQSGDYGDADPFHMKGRDKY